MTNLITHQEDNMTDTHTDLDAQNNPAEDREHESRRIWIAFTGQTELPLLRFLKPGFRHCFIVIKDEGKWLSLDPMANHMDLTVHNVPDDFDLPRWLRSRGLQVIETDVQHHDKPAPLMPLTCVEAVKRMIGLHKRFILTPYQLFRHLEKQMRQKPNTPRIYAPEFTNADLLQKGNLSWEA